jgi:transcriptional regulator with XRE-family HTH domain
MEIKNSRIKHGLTQKQLSELTGIPKRTIENWETGQRKCPVYIENMVIDLVERTFGQPDYKTVLEEVLEMLESDLPNLKTAEAKDYVSNVIIDIKDSMRC